MSVRPTAEQLEVLIEDALKCGDMRGVVAALRLMAHVDPRRADLILELIRSRDAIA